jgi:hypothetical protein
MSVQCQRDQQNILRNNLAIFRRGGLTAAYGVRTVPAWLRNPHDLKFALPTP